ncbi:MAG TPA: glycoside hydrolase domain-containing protein, partial [bacterium]|nr:glycoside hydrolase domain-containing protein [bacterium]
LHSYAPKLQRMDAVETTFLSDYIEIAVPKLDHLGTRYEAYKKIARQGTELWFYTVGIFQASSYPNKTIDLPVIDNRVLHWLNYRYDLTGFLHWGWNQWTDDPFHEVGRHIGDGWMVYPARNGVLNSLRWEEMRNGIQDYEYLWLLEQKVRALKDSLGERFAWIDPTQRGKEIAGRVVPGLAAHTTDPTVLYHAKREILREIMDFDTHPRVYVQTVPWVHSAIKSRSPVEVFGWAEPGTTITINGEQIPIREDGLFMELFSLFPKTNIINIQATNNGKTKHIVRTFQVEY